MRSKVLIVIGTVLLLLLVACSHQHAHVEWPELVAFDHATEELEGQLNQGLFRDEQTDSVAGLQVAGRNLIDSQIPANVASVQLVRHRLDELLALLENLDQAESLTAEQVKPFHALAEALMEAAGMPHVHDH